MNSDTGARRAESPRDVKMKKSHGDSLRGVDQVNIQIVGTGPNPLAGVHSWHIPRPSLIPDSDGESRASQVARGSTSSQGSSSTTSTQSGASGSLLLTAANLASLRCEPLFGGKQTHDTASLASSTHFTVVNGLERRRGKPLPSCCCKKHQLPVLVVAMSALFLLALLAAICYLEMRSRDIHLFT